ncbi:MAG: hypothetical protein HRT89_05145 [Lentisphaeria bacterium]|nr:LamG domain-containing protein [Lentisphaeria bacterium]NQZ67436.1 hypothetical protein [Lentisphaeria bacterium]
MMMAASDKVDFRRLKGWTIEFWIRLKNDAHNSVIFHVPPIQANLSLDCPPSQEDPRYGKIRINGWAGAGAKPAGNKDIHTKSKIVNGQWRYIAVTFERGGKVKVYVDGIFENERDSTGL